MALSPCESRCAASGRFPGARAALEPICNWFAEGRDTADSIAARTLLSGIG